MPFEDTRICADCGISKPEGDFTPGQWVKSSPRCKLCVQVRNLKYQAENKDSIRARRADHYQKNKERLLKNSKKLWSERKDRYEPARRLWAKQHRDEMLLYQKELRVKFLIFIDELKKGKPCADCGKIFPSYVMEYDHVLGKKRFNIGKMTNHKRDRVLEEISKCDLICCACHRIRSHARRKHSKIPKVVAFHTWINILKSNPCVDCGQTFPPEAMDYDHFRGDKVSGVSQMWSWSPEKVQLEISKCELVCANCHRERTIKVLQSKNNIIEKIFG